MAERRIVEGTGQGIVCYISNYSWLDGLSFTGMRERYLEVFDKIRIDCLNGDKYKTGKLTPEGEPDPSVFSSDFNPEGIQVGTAVTLLVRRQSHMNANTVRFRHLWGRTKRPDLLATAVQDGESLYQPLRPALDLGLPYMPTRVDTDYLSWPLLPSVFPVSFPGVKTSRDDVVVDIDRARLVRRMEQYFDPTLSHEELRRITPGAMHSTARFQAEAVRDQLRKRGFRPENIVRYCYRPFDVRWLYWEPETKLLDEKRAEYYPHVVDGNVWIEARQRQPMESFDRGYFVHVLADNFGNGLSSFFPLYLSITAGWGHAGKGGVTMPGKGRVDQGAYTSDERAALGSGASALGLTEEQVIACLGATASNIYLNDTAYWRNVPASVWEYTIGGYQGVNELMEGVRFLQKFPRFRLCDDVGHIVVNQIAFAAAGVKVDSMGRNTGPHSQLQSLKSHVMMPDAADAIA